MLKIVPMEGEMLVNGEPQKRAGEVAAEVAIALALSDLRGAGRPRAPARLHGTLSVLGCFKRLGHACLLCAQCQFRLQLTWNPYFGLSAMYRMRSLRFMLAHGVLHFPEHCHVAMLQHTDMFTRGCGYMQALAHHQPMQRRGSWTRMARACAAGRTRARWRASGPPGTRSARGPCGLAV